MDGQKKLVIEFTPEEELDDLIRRLPRGGTKGCRQRWTKKMLDVWLPIIAIQKEQKKSEQIEARRTRKEEEAKRRTGEKMEAREREYREFREEESGREDGSAGKRIQRI